MAKTQIYANSKLGVDFRYGEGITMCFSIQLSLKRMGLRGFSIEVVILVFRLSFYFVYPLDNAHYLYIFLLRAIDYSP